jgi:nitrate reductase NapE component
MDLLLWIVAILVSLLFIALIGGLAFLLWMFGYSELGR